MRRTIRALLCDRVCLPRQKSFYNQEAEFRHYFYVLDTRGQIFLEETKPRNIATCFKDMKILNFLMKNMQKNATQQHPNIPFISYCGKEINFISPVDIYSSLCFKDIQWESNQLIYGGNLEHPFNPFSLAYHPESGRIYHPIQSHKYLKGTYGLLHPHLCQKIGENIVPAHVSQDSNHLTDIKQQRNYLLKWNDEILPLKVLDDSPTD
jgi:hypothetical protein